jgi:hypothetical protein
MVKQFTISIKINIMEDNTNKPINWQAAREHLKREYPDLTEEDLAYEAGREEELLERLQGKVNKSKHEIRSWLSLMG